MRYLIKAVANDVITTTESNDLDFIIALFGEYYNSEIIHYDKIDLVDNTTGEILAYFYEDKGKIEFYWTLGDHTLPDIIF